MKKKKADCWLQRNNNESDVCFSVAKMEWQWNNMFKILGEKIYPVILTSNTKPLTNNF